MCVNLLGMVAEAAKRLEHKDHQQVGGTLFHRLHCERTCGSTLKGDSLRIRRQQDEDAAEEDKGDLPDGEQNGQREEMALLRESDSLHLAGTTVRQTMKAAEENDKDFNAWTTVKIQSTEFLRRIIAPFGGQGGSHFRTRALTAIVSRRRLHLVVFDEAREESEQSLGFTDSTERGEGASGPRSAEGCLRESRVRSLALGESAAEVVPA